MTISRQKQLFRPKIYIQKNIAARWRREAKSGEAVLVFSPYVTPPCARNVLQASFGDCKLYTVFSAKNFATGASSLEVIEKLLESGVEVFHIPGLHAKIMLVPGQAATIGSQNLTGRGQVNKEASVLLMDEASVQQVKQEALPWLEQAIQIDKAMIADMRRSLKDLKKLFTAADREAELLDNEVWTNYSLREREREERERQEQEEKERERQEAERRERERQEAEERMHLFREQIQDGIRRSRTAKKEVCGEIKPYGTKYGILKLSLITDKNSSYIDWWVGEESVELERAYRYLCINEDTCRLGWARVFPSRITMIGKSIKRTDRLVLLDGWGYNVLLTAEWDQEKLSSHNLTVTLENYPWKAELDCMFMVDSLRVVAARSNAPEHLEAAELMAKFSSNQAGVLDSLVDLVISPFKYEENLFGFRANNFFGGREPLGEPPWLWFEARAFY